jgi:hypothetical protein
VKKCGTNVDYCVKMPLYHSLASRYMLNNHLSKFTLTHCVISVYSMNIHFESIQSKPPHVVTCIKRSPFSCPIIENFIWIESLLRGHLSYNVTFSFSQRWPLKTGLTVYFLWNACFVSRCLPKCLLVPQIMFLLNYWPLWMTTAVTVDMV